MDYQLAAPLWLNEQGRRDYNEDSIFPKPDGTPVSSANRIFMVCDGVGGSVRGDMASRLLCETFPEMVKQTPFTESDYNKQALTAILNDRLRKAEAVMEQYSIEKPEVKGMATTLTFLWFSEQGVVTAWAGDSRIYQFRDGQVVYQTEDHSLVNELVKRGEISREEARHHPRRNVILRAVSGASNPTRVDVDILRDVRAGDVFLLCTDGILEGFESDEELWRLMASGRPLKEIKEEIRQRCAARSNDNYSMYLIQVEEVKNPLPATEEPAAGATVQTSASQLEAAAAATPAMKSPGKRRLGILSVALLGTVLILTGVWFVLGGKLETLFGSSPGSPGKPSVVMSTAYESKMKRAESLVDSIEVLRAWTMDTLMQADSNQAGLKFYQSQLASLEDRKKTVEGRIENLAGQLIKLRSEQDLEQAGTVEETREQDPIRKLWLEQCKRLNGTPEACREAYIEEQVKKAREENKAETNNNGSKEKETATPTPGTYSCDNLPSYLTHHHRGYEEFEIFDVECVGKFLLYQVARKDSYGAYSFSSGKHFYPPGFFDDYGGFFMEKSYLLRKKNSKRWGVISAETLKPEKGLDFKYDTISRENCPESSMKYLKAVKRQDTTYFTEDFKERFKPPCDIE